jgi:hypothetical protein
MGEARYADGSALACEFRGSGAEVRCHARDSSGNLGECTTDATASASFVDNARAINSASAVVLYWDPATKRCHDMRLIQGSQFLPDYHSANPATALVTVAADHAEGSLGPIRYNPLNANDFISCDLWASGYIYCMARNNAGRVAACSTREGANPSFAEAVRAIDSVSHVKFSFDPATAACSSIVVNKNSNNLP